MIIPRVLLFEPCECLMRACHYFFFYSTDNMIMNLLYQTPWTSDVHFARSIDVKQEEICLLGLVGLLTWIFNCIMAYSNFRRPDENLPKIIMWKPQRNQLL